MSQVSNKVQWCLNKAQKELNETGLHRGLVKVNPDIQLAEKHLKKAEHNLNAALYFDKGGYSDWSASGFFYCTYHCFLAICRMFGYESRNQECTIALIEMLKEEGKIIIDNKFINTLKITKIKEIDNSIIKMREEFQYGVETNAGRKEFENFSKMCKELLSITKDIVHNSEENKPY